MPQRVCPCCATGDHARVSIQSATLPAPSLLRAATTPEQTNPTLRCIVRLATGRLTVTAAAQAMLHFSAELVGANALTPLTHAASSDLDTGMTAGQPLAMLRQCTLMPASMGLAQSTDVTAALARPADTTDGYRMHPSVLDGSFQLGAAVPSASVPQTV